MPSPADIKQGGGAKTAGANRNVLAFHKLTGQLTFGSTNYSPRRFSALLESLKESGYNFVTLEKVIEAPVSKEIAITFDDGYAHLYKTLPQFIERFELKPTIFIPTAFIGKQNSWDYSTLLKPERHLSHDEIKELRSIGVDFGSHGHTHCDLRRCTTAALNDELAKSKGILEEITGQPVTSLSYPFGRFSKRITEYAQRTGYSCGFTMNFPEQSDRPMTLGRVAVYFFDNAVSTRHKLNDCAMRKIHKGIGRVVNYLSIGTILLNMITGRTGRIESASS